MVFEPVTKQTFNASNASKSSPAFRRGAQDSGCEQLQGQQQGSVAARQRPDRDNVRRCIPSVDGIARTGAPQLKPKHLGSIVGAVLGEIGTLQLAQNRVCVAEFTA